MSGATDDGSSGKGFAAHDPGEDGPLVIGLDSSTQSTKAIAWDRQGRAVAEGRAAIALANPALGRFEQDPEDWWRSAVAALADCARQIDTGRLEGLAISNQRETIAFLDRDGRSVRPAMIWLDERARAEVERFADAFGAEEIHRITGRVPDVIPCLYRFAWVKRHEPEVWARTASFADVQAFLVQRLCGGELRTGWMSADPLGIFDLVDKRWSRPILDALGLDPSRLPEPHAPGTRLGTITADAADACALPEGLPVFAAGGDGQCAGLGTNCTVPERAYINLGTAVVSGIWSPEYRHGRSWRTEIAGQGEGYILENCLRSGAFLIDWFVDRFVAHGKADEAVFERLEKAALALPIGSDGLLVQPYFAGSMDPHWDSTARGVILGLSGSHTEVHVYRALIEAITIDQAMRTEDMEAASGQRIEHFVAVGGGARSPLWRQMLADATGRPVHVSETVEASALGAGMIAAAGAGWYDSITAAARAMAGETTPVHPDTVRGAAYAELIDIYRGLYAATSALNTRMVAFAAEQRERHTAALADEADERSARIDGPVTAERSENA